MNLDKKFCLKDGKWSDNIPELRIQDLELRTQKAARHHGNKGI
jgi:hypothetical protein